MNTISSRAEDNQKWRHSFYITEILRFVFDLHSGKKRIIAKFIIPQLDKNKSVVLDYGCGSGNYTKIYAKNAKLVIGYDNSKTAIEFAKAINSDENLIYFDNYDDMKKKLEEYELNTIIFNDVLEFEKDWQNIFEDMLYKFNKVNRCFITCPNFTYERSFYIKIRQTITNMLGRLFCDIKHRIKNKILEIEKNNRHHKLYNRIFNEEFEEYLNGKKLDFQKIYFFLDGMANNLKNGNHLLYIIKTS